MKKETGIRMTLVKADEWTSSGVHYRSEQWKITGGEVDPSWRREVAQAGWEPWCRFSLYVVDGEVDVRLSSYGGEVWPVAWPDLFEARGHGYGRAVQITDLGLQFRAASLDGASDMYADARLVP